MSDLTIEYGKRSRLDGFDVFDNFVEGFWGIWIDVILVSHRDLIFGFAVDHDGSDDETDDGNEKHTAEDNQVSCRYIAEEFLDGIDFVAVEFLNSGNIDLARHAFACGRIDGAANDDSLWF